MAKKPCGPCHVHTLSLIGSVVCLRTDRTCNHGMRGLFVACKTFSHGLLSLQVLQAWPAQPQLESDRLSNDNAHTTSSRFHVRDVCYDAPRKAHVPSKH